MRFMVIVKATKNSEAGALPTKRLLAEMGAFNEELSKAGVMLAGEGLQPSSKGARVKFSGNKRTVVDGPFPETKELVAGFWLWQVKSKQEAIEWVKRCPHPMPGEDAVIEIRQLFEAEDFGEEFTPEMRRHRVRQANLMGPSGYVSIDDSEIMMASQAGISPYPKADGLFEMGGREARNEAHMVTEGAIRGFYRYYRQVMGL